MCGLSICYFFCLECSSGLAVQGSIRFSLKCLLNKASPATPPKTDSPYLFPFPLIFFSWLLITIKILSIVFIYLIILPPTRMVAPRGQRFLPSLFTVESPVPKHCLALRRRSTDVLKNEYHCTFLAGYYSSRWCSLVSLVLHLRGNGDDSMGRCYWRSLGRKSC